MAIEVHEQFESRPSTEGENPSTELIYEITGTDDDLLAKAALAAHAPTTYDGLVRKSLSIDVATATTWKGTVSYGERTKEETGGHTCQFEIGGGNTHITQSLDTVGGYAPAGSTPPNFQGAIGVTHDDVQGCDIYTPEFRFSETHYLDANLITDAYKATLWRIASAPMNADAFRQFAPGECLFMGASGSKRSEEDWEINYSFAASPNAAGLYVGTIGPINKYGWDYLWVRYADEEDTGSGRLVKVPVAAYVERVYGWSIFSALGIG